MSAEGPRGRYAPSPTGELHLGNASSALLAWLSIRARGGTFLMRMEDLDRGRARPELARRVLDDLAWLGLDWDADVVVQSERTRLYDAAFERLLADARLYPCFCSRKDVARAASAPQEPGEERRYGGSCRDLDPRVAKQRVDGGLRHAWRFRVRENDDTAFDDLVHGRRASREPPGDFVVRRSDGVTAYQLAVVVDDADMRIDEVVRGDDLLASTARQLLLYRALDLQSPAFGHVPLLIDETGERLSKRQQGITIRELRDAGHGAEWIVGRIADWLGLRPTSEPTAARALIDGFDLRRLAPRPGGIVVDATGRTSP